MGRVACKGVGPTSSARARQLTPEAWEKAPFVVEVPFLFVVQGYLAPETYEHLEGGPIMSDYMLRHEMVKEHQAQLRREAAAVRRGPAARRPGRLSTTLRNLVALILPLH